MVSKLIDYSEFAKNSEDPLVKSGILSEHKQRVEGLVREILEKVITDGNIDYLKDFIIELLSARQTTNGAAPDTGKILDGLKLAKAETTRPDWLVKTIESLGLADLKVDSTRSLAKTREEALAIRGIARAIAKALPTKPTIKPIPTLEFFGKEPEAVPQKCGPTLAVPNRAF